jgi:phosphatidylglycerophosphatase A
MIAGFALFRAFDIFKPYPINRLQGLSGGLGVMMDDALAGVYAAVTLSLLLTLVI